MNTISQLGRIAAQRMNKTADEGQPVDAPLGSLQHAYVADAIGAEASARAAAQTKDHPDVEDSMINEMIAQSAGHMEPLQRRIRHGASRLSESAGGRMMSAFDPTGLLSENPDANLTNLIMGAGKKNPEREELVKQRYANVLKKHQDKLDPNAELTERDTPWHRMQQGDLANLDSDIAGHSYMRSEKPLQYWLNPFDRSGPLNELGDRASRRLNAGMAYPDSTGGRFGMGLGTLGTLGLLPLLTGGEKAQQSLRGSAAKNKLYADVAEPERKGEKKDKEKDKEKDTEKDAAIAEFFFKSAGKPVAHPPEALMDPALPFNETSNPLNPNRYKGKSYKPFPAYRREPVRGKSKPATGGYPPTGTPLPVPPTPAPAPAPPVPPAPVPPAPAGGADINPGGAEHMPNLTAPDYVPGASGLEAGALPWTGETDESYMSPPQFQPTAPPEYGAGMPIEGQPHDPALNEPVGEPINDPTGHYEGDLGEGVFGQRPQEPVDSWNQGPEGLNNRGPDGSLPETGPAYDMQGIAPNEGPGADNRSREEMWDDIHSYKGWESDYTGNNPAIRVAKDKASRIRWQHEQTKLYGERFPEAVTREGNKTTTQPPARNQRVAEQMRNAELVAPINPSSPSPSDNPSPNILPVDPGG